MNQHELHNYLPFNTQYRNKYEDCCPLFYGELAVADSDFRILTARGPSLCEGSRFALTDANKRFLFKNADRDAAGGSSPPVADRSGIGRAVAGRLLYSSASRRRAERGGRRDVLSCRNAGHDTVRGGAQSSGKVRRRRGLFGGGGRDGAVGRCSAPGVRAVFGGTLRADRVLRGMSHPV